MSQTNDDPDVIAKFLKRQPETDDKIVRIMVASPIETPTLFYTYSVPKDKVETFVKEINQFLSNHEFSTFSETPV